MLIIDSSLYTWMATYMIDRANDSRNVWNLTVKTHKGNYDLIQGYMTQHDKQDR